MAFVLKKHGDLQYFVPENIKTVAVFTTRLGGFSGDGDINSPLYSLNFAFKEKYDKTENVDKNYRTIAESLGFSVNNIIYASQKHTDNILVCDENFLNANKNNMLPLPEDFVYDTMVTNIPDVLLSVRIADCVPVLFWDEEHNAVGAAHCGWKGTLQKLQIKTAQKMRELYGTDLSKLKVAIGPCISKCCYEVSEEFYKNFVNTLGERVKIYFEEKNGEKYLCDLKGVNKMLLSNVIDEKNIEVAQNCTYCEKDLFYSYRRQGEYRGAHAAFIGVKEE